MVDAPGCGITDAQLALQRQCRQARLNLANQMDGQKPNGQRKVRALEHRTGNERSAVSSAGGALKVCVSHFLGRFI